MTSPSLNKKYEHTFGSVQQERLQFTTQRSQPFTHGLTIQDQS